MTLGLHSKLNGLDRDLIDDIIAARPTIFVGVGDAGTLPIMKRLHDALGDSCAFIFRNIPSEKNWENHKSQQTDPELVAGQMLVDVEGIITLANRETGQNDDYRWMLWQGLNEPKNDMAWLADLDYQRAVKFRAAGRRVVIGSFARGNPEPEEISLWDDALREANNHPDEVRLAMHFYWDGADPDADYIWQLGRWGFWSEYCKSKGYTNVIPNMLCTEYGAEPGWRLQGLTPQRNTELLVEGDEVSPWMPKAIYDLSIIPDDEGKPHGYGIQENVQVSRRPLVIIRPVDEILQVIRDQAKPGPDPAPAPNPNPDPAPAPVTRAQLTATVYLRATPEMRDDKTNVTGLLGSRTVIQPGATQGSYTEAWIADARLGWVWTGYLVPFTEPI